GGGRLPTARAASARSRSSSASISSNFVSLEARLSASRTAASRARRSSRAGSCTVPGLVNSLGSIVFSLMGDRYPGDDPSNHHAGVAELADAPGLGPGGLRLLEVRLLSPASEPPP